MGVTVGCLYQMFVVISDDLGTRFGTARTIYCPHAPLMSVPLMTLLLKPKVYNSHNFEMWAKPVKA